MAIVKMKVCPRPGCDLTYNIDFKSNYCDICGANLLIEETEIENKNIDLSDILGLPEVNINEELSNKDVSNREVSNKEVHNEEIYNYNEEIYNKEPYSKDVSNKEISNKEVPNKNNYNKEISKEPIFIVDSLGFIHFTEYKEKEELNADKIVVYVGKKIYKEFPLEYDETIIGRDSVKFTPDIDLSEIDLEGYTSRRHLMIYKEDDRFYARNLSTKNSVHVERDALAQGESKELNDNDLILLSKYIVIVFKKKK